MEADLPAVPVVGRLISTATLGAKVSLLGGHPLHIARCLEIGPVLSQTGGPGLEAATLIQVLCNARQEKAEQALASHLVMGMVGHPCPLPLHIHGIVLMCSEG